MIKSDLPELINILEQINFNLSANYLDICLNKFLKSESMITN